MPCHDLDGIAKIGVVNSHNGVFTKVKGWATKGILLYYLDQQSKQRLNSNIVKSKSIDAT
jgi:hypothetical protein